MQTKAEIRKMMRAREMEQSTLPVELVSARAESIWSTLEGREDFQRARTILIYMSMPGEVPTREFIAKWAGRKRIVLPKVIGDDLELRVYDPSMLQRGYREIEEPTSDAAVVAPQEIDLAIVPGVAFARRAGGWLEPSRRGGASAESAAAGVARLGHGKGYYDRLLSRLDCPKIGVGFAYRFVEEIPSEPWDILLDDAISE